MRTRAAGWLILSTVVAAGIVAALVLEGDDDRGPSVPAPDIQRAAPPPQAKEPPAAPTLQGSASKGGSGGWLRRLLGLDTEPGASDGVRTRRRSWSRTRPLRGIVIDEQDRPVSSASVWVRGWFDDDMDREPVARTGPDGRFDTKVPRATSWARATGPGLVSNRAVEVPDDADDIRLMVVRAEVAVVEVVDRRSRLPIPRALVNVDGWSAATDSAGTVEVSVPAGDDPVRVSASANGYAPGSATMPRETGRPVRIQVALGIGGTVDGRVEDARGAPVHGAKVEAGFGRPFAFEAKTDERGRFALANVPTQLDMPHYRAAGGAALTLYVEAAGHPSHEESVELPEEGAIRTIVVRLPGRRTLTGRVVLRDGSPVAGVRVRSGGFGERTIGGRGPGSTTSNDGSFSIDGIGPERGWITVLDREGRELHTKYGVEVPPSGDVPPVLIVLESARFDRRSVLVSVVDASGAPVQGASVRVLVDSSWSHETTDAQGRATLTNLPPRRLAFHVATRTGASEGVVVDVATESSAAVRLGSGVIEGRVVRPDGGPARAEVSVAKEVRWEDEVTGMSVEGRGDSHGASEVITSADGTFRIAGLGDGDYRLWFGEVEGGSRWSHGPVRAGTTDVRLVVGTPPSPYTFEVEAAGDPLPKKTRQDRGASLGVRVVTDLVVVTLVREPEEPIRLHLFPTAEEPNLYRSDPGRTVFEEDVPTGDYDVTVRPGTGALPVHLGLQRVRPGVNRWKVTRSLGARVEGRVVDATGAPISDVSVRAGPPGWKAEKSRPYQSASTGTDGRYAITGLQDGDVEVVAVPGLYSPPVVESSRRITVSATETTRLDLTLVVGGSLEVWLAEGASLREGFTLRLTAPTGDVRELTKSAREVTDQRNGHRWPRYPWGLEGMAPGRHTIEVVWDGVRLPPTHLDVRPLETSLLTLPPR